MAACLCLCMMLPSLAVRGLPYNRLRCWFKRTCCPCRCPYVYMRHNCFCLVFSRKLNIISALSVHQPLTLSQKIDSRGGLFWYQKGVVVHAGKMYFYLNGPSPTPVLGRFAAKCKVKWCKTQCKMGLNARQKA